MKCRIKDGEVICRKVSYNLSRVSEERVDKSVSNDGGAKVSVSGGSGGIANDALVC